MRRRQFVALLASATVAPPLVSHAQHRPLGLKVPATLLDCADEPLRRRFAAAIATR